MLKQMRMLDEMYRQAPKVYHPIREAYLEGTYRLLHSLEVRPGDNVLDWNCGTGHNVFRLARRHAQSQFYAMEAYPEVAEKTLAAAQRRKLDQNLHLKLRPEGVIDPRAVFDLPTDGSHQWDAIYFNYVLSELPEWEEVLAIAFRQLRPGRSIYVCDFWDSNELPEWMLEALVVWYRDYELGPNYSIAARIQNIAIASHGSCLIRPVACRFAFVARLTKGSDERAVGALAVGDSRQEA